MIIWTLLPEMDKGYCGQSALFIGTGDDEEDEVVLVVGGRGGTGKEAALLTQQFTQGFQTTYLVKFNDRIIAVGELFFYMLLICQNNV